MCLCPNRNRTMSAATLPNSIAKARMSPFLSGYKYLGYVSKLTGADLVNKIFGRESSPVLSNTCQTNPACRQCSIIKPSCQYTVLLNPIVSLIFTFGIIFVHSK